MSYLTATGIANGGSQTFVAVDTWTNFTVSYTPSDYADTGAGVAVSGSADEGVTWFPLSIVSQSDSDTATGTGANAYTGIPVNAVKVQVHCTAGNTVNLSVTGH